MMCRKIRYPQNEEKSKITPLYLEMQPSRLFKFQKDKASQSLSKALRLNDRGEV